jgi:hypothetical protein
MDLQHAHAAWIRSMDLQYGHEAQKFRTDMQIEQAAWKSSWEIQHGHACTLLKTLAFLLAEWIWALEPGFQCGAAKGEKKHEFALSFFSARRFRFSGASFSSRSCAHFFTSRSQSRKRGKSAGAYVW